MSLPLAYRLSQVRCDESRDRVEKSGVADMIAMAVASVSLASVNEYGASYFYIALVSLASRGEEQIK